MAIESCPNCNEPVYSGTSVCPHCRKQTAQLQPQKPLQTYEQPLQKSVNHLIEYRRTCQVCGKVWHSLVSREKHVTSRQTNNSLLACGGALQSVGSCGLFGSGLQAQASRNADANQSELQRLRSCPECSSANYKEEVIDHANQIG